MTINSFELFFIYLLLVYVPMCNDILQTLTNHMAALLADRALPFSVVARATLITTYNLWI